MELERLRALLDKARPPKEIAVELSQTPLGIYGQLQRLYRKRTLATSMHPPGTR